jgi:hypothetical protein
MPFRPSIPRRRALIGGSIITTVVLLLLLTIVSSCIHIPPAPRSPSQEFEQFVNDYFRGKFSVRPDSQRTFQWLRPDHDSLSAITATAALKALRSIDTAALGVPERIDWLQLEAGLRRQIRDTSLHRSKQDPSGYLTLGNLPWKIAGSRTPSADEWGEVLKTLRDAPAALSLGRDQLDHPPPLWVKLAVNTAKRYEDMLTGPLVEKIKQSAPDSLKAALTLSAGETVNRLASFRNFIQDTLPPGPEGSWMVGTSYYDWVLENFHFLPYTSAGMIDTGWRIHRETKQMLEAVAHRMNPSGSLEQTISAMKARHPEASTIADAYHRQSDRVRQLLISHDLVAIPPAETLVFVPTPPDLRETYAWGGYGGIEESAGVRVGRFFVTDVVPGMTPAAVTEKLRIQNFGWITVIALHEGYPGHHLQTLYAMKSPRQVRSRLGSTYYGEGWALFAESWMGRSGFYTTADDTLAWLQMRLWRTARVIVDPSIHTGRMTYEQAVQFMVDEVGLERSAAEAEVNRYTTWPTQAPSYIIGWLEIERLRNEIRSREGSAFSEKKFVETLLGVGSLPLALMRRAVLQQYGFK